MPNDVSLRPVAASAIGYAAGASAGAAAQSSE